MQKGEAVVQVQVLRRWWSEPWVSSLVATVTYYKAGLGKGKGKGDGLGMNRQGRGLTRDQGNMVMMLTFTA